MAEFLNPMASVDGGPVKVGPSMWSIYEHGAEGNQDHTALIVVHQPSDRLEKLVGPSSISHDCLNWTYQQLQCGAARLAASLRSRGVIPGSTIATLITNCAEWALITWAAAIGKYSVGLLDPRAVQPARVDELKYFLKTLKPSAVVVDDESGIHALDSVIEEFSINVKLRICRSSEQPVPAPWTMFDNLVQDQETEPLPSDDDLNRFANFMFTSGTSVGHPKGVPRTVENWLTCAAMNCMYPLSRDTVASITTLCFRIQFNTLAIAVWHAGGTLIIPSPEFDGEKFLDAVDKYGVNWLQPVFQHLFPIIDAPSFSREKVKSIKRIYIGGDVITAEHLAQWKEYFPTALFANYFGMTEGTGIVGWPDNEVPQPIPVLEGSVSAGKAAPGTKLRIVDGDGNIVKKGEKGELHIGGLVMTPSYLEDVQAEYFYTDREGRWMKTGDIAVIDEYDRLFVLGRSKDVIMRKGVVIPPSSLESCLKKYGNVVAQVIGIASERYGEEVYAIVENLNHRSVQELKDMAVELFGAEFSISEIVTLKQLGMTKWPKNSADKVLKKDLKKALTRFLRND